MPAFTHTHTLTHTHPHTQLVCTALTRISEDDNYACIHTYTHTHPHTPTHTYTHTHLHTQLVCTALTRISEDDNLAYSIRQCNGVTLLGKLLLVQPAPTPGKGPACCPVLFQSCFCFVAGQAPPSTACPYTR